MIFFETERLLLRNVITEDADIMFDYRNNEVCARYQRGQTKTYDGIKELVERRKEDIISTESPFMIAVALKDTNEMIGEIVVMPNENTFSLGYTFSYKYHRQGYAFEALTVLIDFLHEKYGDWEFISFTDPRNEASMGLLMKLGYKNLGYISSKDSQAFGKWITKETEEEFKQANDINLVKYYPNYSTALAWYQDLDLCKQVDNRDMVYDLATLKRMYKYLNKKGDLYYIKYKNRLCGDVCLQDSGEINIVVAKEFQNKHIGRRVIQEIVLIAKEKKFKELYAVIYSFNTQSKRMFESVGFRQIEDEKYILPL